MQVLTRFAGLLAGMALAAPMAFAAPSAYAQKTVVATIAQIGEPLSVIAKDRANIVTLIGEGVDPPSLSPHPVGRCPAEPCRPVLYNGLHLEAQLLSMMDRFAAGKPVIAISDALTAPTCCLWEGKIYDPHIWMDPSLWARALQKGVDALAEIDPRNGDFYRANAKDLF